MIQTGNNIMLLRLIVSLAVVISSFGCTKSASRLTSRQASWSELQSRLQPYYRFQQPQGSGPFPTVLIVPGCSGFSHPRAPNAYASYIERLKDLGHAVFVVDYVSAEGISDACGGRLSSAQVSEYVSAATSYCATLPFVNRDQIRIIGWSLGGGGLLSALDTIEAQRIPIRGALALYPVCRDVQPWRSQARTVILLGGLDNIQPPEICQQLVERVPTGRVVLRLYQGAHHGFDWSELPTRTEHAEQPTLGLNPEAAQAAWKEIIAFLRD